MTPLKITDRDPDQIPETPLKKEKLLKHDLEEWIANEPSILRERLLIIGRQVNIPELNERIDLLAVDLQGNVVIIELKHGTQRGPVDIKAFCHASYIAKWRYEDFEYIAKCYYKKTDDSDFNFEAHLEQFNKQSGLKGVPDLNKDQRIIITGSAIGEKLARVGLWLRDHDVNIRLVEVKICRQGERILIKSAIIVP